MIRGFLLDSARCLEQRSFYRRAIDFLAQRGCNVLLWHFTDDQGCAYDFRSIPGIGSPHAYSLAEMKDLIHYAADRGIELVPEVASLGHSRYITRLPAYAHLNEDDSAYSGICPVSNETRDVVRRLIEETAEVFESPNLHVGLDEANFGAHPATRAALQQRTRDELFVEHLQFVQQVVEGCGRRMWMWSDGLLAGAAGTLERVSPRIVQCHWHYKPDVDPAADTRRLLDAGFDVVLVPALISFNQTLLPGNDVALANVRTLKQHERLNDSSGGSNGSGGGGGGGRVLGMITSTWMPYRYLTEAQWLSFDLAARVMRDDAPPDFSAAVETFGRTFYRLQSIERWTRACTEILRLAPGRHEWLAIAKNDGSTTLGRAELADRARRWRQLQQHLRALRPEVQRHRRAYRAFYLTVAMIAHAYQAASQTARGSNADPRVLRELLRRGRRLLGQVERAWDRGRFADDPVKHVPAIGVFRDDHLIVILNDGVRALEASACSPAVPE